MLNVFASTADNSDSNHILGYIFDKHRNPPANVKIPQRLCPRLLTDELRTSLAVPVLAPGAPRTDLRLDLHRMSVAFTDTADDCPVPSVPVPPLRADVCAALELHILRSTDGSAAQV